MGAPTLSCPSSSAATDVVWPHSSLVAFFFFIYLFVLPWWLSVKNPPAVQETQVSSLGWEGPLEKEMAIHSKIPNWRIPWTEEPGGL